jgi:hypothetical protein
MDAALDGDLVTVTAKIFAIFPDKFPVSREFHG